MKRLVWLFLPACYLLLLLPGVASAVPSFDQAIDKLTAKGYQQGLEDYFTSLGTNPALGFRWAGTSAEKAVSYRVQREMRAMGLSGVQLEPVPVDVFEYKSSSVRVGGWTIPASAWGGTPPTGPDGITAEVVYVGGGAATDYIGKDVRGKIVLADFDWWPNLTGAEAVFQGAKALILTNGANYGYYYIADDALGSFDATYQFSSAPMVYISQKDGDELKKKLAAGPVTATMTCDIDVTMADDGGVAYNVVGTLKGSSRDGQQIVLTAHQDVHFRAGMDDTAALVNMLAIAKAMRQSGYRPVHDVVFLATTGEEFGYTNCYYDWLAGSWYAATQSHRDWAGRTRAVLGMELMGLEGAKLRGSISEELLPFFNKLAADNKNLLPWDKNFYTTVYCWNDQWPFSANGIPSISFGTGGPYYSSLYHTNYETKALVNFDYLGKIAKFIYRSQKGIDQGLLPYSLATRAGTLADSVNGQELLDAGAAPAVVTRLTGDLDLFSAATQAFDGAASAIPAGRVEATNTSLLQIVKVVDDKFTALDVWDYTIYPHQQVLWNVQGVKAAADALPGDPDAALAAIKGVGQMVYGVNFSHAVFVEDQSRHDPGYYNVKWGGQGQLADYLDLTDQWNEIKAKQYEAAQSSLRIIQAEQLRQLNVRLGKMADVLEEVTPQIEAITP